MHGRIFDASIAWSHILSSYLGHQPSIFVRQPAHPVVLHQPARSQHPVSIKPCIQHRSFRDINACASHWEGRQRASIHCFLMCPSLLFPWDPACPSIPPRLSDPISQTTPIPLHIRLDMSIARRGWRFVLVSPFVQDAQPEGVGFNLVVSLLIRSISPFKGSLSNMDPSLSLHLSHMACKRRCFRSNVCNCNVEASMDVKLFSSLTCSYLSSCIDGAHESGKMHGGRQGDPHRAESKD